MKGQPFPRGCRADSVSPAWSRMPVFQSSLLWARCCLHMVGFLFYFVLTEHEIITINKSPLENSDFTSCTGCGHFVIKAHRVSTFCYVVWSEDPRKGQTRAPCEQAQAGNCPYLAGALSIGRMNSLNEQCPTVIKSPNLNLPDSANSIFLMEKKYWLWKGTSFRTPFSLRPLDSVDRCAPIEGDVSTVWWMAESHS